MSGLDPVAGEPSVGPPSPAEPLTLRPVISLPLPVWLPPTFFLLLALVFLWRALFTGDVFLPASLLGHVAPWKFSGHYPVLPPWNPLRWDGIGQFYPWRKFAAETIRAGMLPLWNPYQFCGAPFLANSQSAVLYPGSVLFYAIPDTAAAFGWNAVLHLTLCGWFTYLLLRRLRCSEVASLLGGVVFAYSAWQAAWLQLPTFLATSCWFPLLLRQIIAGSNGNVASFPVDNPPIPGSKDCRASLPAVGTLIADSDDLPESSPVVDDPLGSAEGPISADSCGPDADSPLPSAASGHALRSGSRSTAVSILVDACGIGAVVGMMLLAGHLQVALYGLLSGTLLAAGLLLSRRASPVRLIPWGAGLLLGLILAMPQLLPAVELSRVSHRVGKPSASGFAAYTGYALPPSGVLGTLLPDFFGGDSDVANPYWAYYRVNIGSGQTIAVRHNPAETAIYVGILPLLLGLFACARGLSRNDFDGRTALFAALALCALLLALGTPLNALLYFGIPGFAQSGSPARCLALWALAAAGLSALGLDQLTKRLATEREVAVVFGAVIVLAAVALNLASRSLADPPPGIRDLPQISEVMARIGTDWIRLGILLLAGAALLKGSLSHLRSGLSWAAVNPTAVVALGLVVLDLFWTNIGANPTARRDQVYPETAGIAYLRQNAGHDRIFPVNQRWSLFASPPVTLLGVLPPNAATVFGLRDVQGYDSLFPGRYKAYANRFARPNRIGLVDASPIEVGNIVFFQDANAPGVADTGAAYALAVPYDQPGFPPGAVPPVTPVDTGDSGMMVYELPSRQGRARIEPAAGGSSIGWIEDSPTRVTLTADARSPATVSLTDAAMAGWQLRVDGSRAAFQTSASEPIRRSVPVPAGRHTLAFRYEPATFRVGLYAACAGLLVCAGVACLQPFKRRDSVS